MIDQLFTGKIRLRLLVRLLLNPGNQVYLRQLERELHVSSNTVRLELNKLTEMKLINVVETEETKIKKYIANTLHPLYGNLRSIVLKYVGVDHLLEEIFNKLGTVQEVFLTGDFANGMETPFIDLVLVGDVDRERDAVPRLVREGLTWRRLVAERLDVPQTQPHAAQVEDGDLVAAVG